MTGDRYSTPIVSTLSNTVACETLDVVCAGCGAHCATWVGEDERGDRQYTLDCFDEDGLRYIVYTNDVRELQEPMSW